MRSAGSGVREIAELDVGLRQQVAGSHAFGSSAKAFWNSFAASLRFPFSLRAMPSPEWAEAEAGSSLSANRNWRSAAAVILLREGCRSLLLVDARLLRSLLA